MAHTTHEELVQRLNKAKLLVKIGGQYSHYRSTDKFYTIVDIAILEATEEAAVIYKANYGGGLTWIRSINDFTAQVEVDGKMVDRFTKVN